MTILSPLRLGRITGSRVGAVLGLNPHQSAADVLRDMVREHFGALSEFDGNEATEYGAAHEPEALAAYEAREGVMTYGGGDCIVHPEHDFLAATPDGLVGEAGMIECKCPFRGRYTHWREKPYYEAQMRLQLECAGRQWCDFVVLHRDGSLHVSRLEHDPAWLPTHLPTLLGFMAQYRAATLSRETAAEHLADRERSDAAWRQAAAAYREAKAAADAAAANEKAARDALIALAPSGAKGCGLSLVRSERAGSVQYAKALQHYAPTSDLAPFAGKPSIVYTVRESA